MSSMNVARLISLDVLGTCLKVRGSVGEIYAEAAASLGIKSDTDQLNRVFKNVYSEMITQHPNFGAASGISSHMWWNETIHKTFQQSDVDLGRHRDSLSESLYKDFATSKCWEVYHDVVPFLESANQLGISLAVVSNIDERLGSILDSLGLLKYFAFVLGSRSLNCMKPSPLLFQLLMQKSGLNAKDILHVGNSKEDDYLPAKLVGMKALLLLRDDTKEEPALDCDVIYSLTQIISSKLFKI